MEHSENAPHIHYDAEASKIGMWMFIFTELLLFGGLFIVYSVYRYMNPDAFHLAADELDRFIGSVNTIILLVSSMFIAMSTSALQQKKKRLTLFLCALTVFLGIVFLINKYFEWGLKFQHGIWPGSPHMLETMSQGEILFFGLYFIMTGLHALHIIVGLVIIGVAMRRIVNGTVHENRAAMLENAGLYWHLVDVIWIFLFPLFYLIT